MIKKECQDSRPDTDTLSEGLQESVDTSAIHLDVLSNLKRINSHITNIAYPILEENGE